MGISKGSQWVSGEARHGEPKQAGGLQGSCLQNLEGKLQLPQDRLAGEEPLVEEQPSPIHRRQKERHPISPSCCPLTSYQCSHVLNPAGIQRTRRSTHVSRARQEARATDQEGGWRGSRQCSHWEERKAAARCAFILYEGTLHIIILVTKKSFWVFWV